MAILKCKMCGGDIAVNESQTYGTCDSCGSTMTLPKASDERIANLFNRANHFRRANDFDKALASYENILNEDDTNAEAHWGAVLSKYGIEYVEDPLSHERIPTCHRVQFESILSDYDYLQAIEHAPDGYSRSLYEEEAKAISILQKNILQISNNEEPFDVFLCYKETTATGTRTKDSTIAQDIYYQLNEQGFKVFFSRITLEDKIGREYEPYIFAALNSAKVMLVIGTSPEYFNATWVKNEWSRYLSIVKKDRSKLIIPCYSQMDPYDLPEELSALQSQDMGKIGFIQDIIRGVKKVLQKDQPVAAPAAAPNAYVQTAPLSSSVQSLLKRAMIFIEDRQFDSADEYLEKILDIDPECADAYLGRLLRLFGISSLDNLGASFIKYLNRENNEFHTKHNSYPKLLAEYDDCIKAMRFADDNFKAKIQAQIDIADKETLDLYEKKYARVTADIDGLTASINASNESIEKHQASMKVNEPKLNKNYDHYYQAFEQQQKAHKKHEWSIGFADDVRYIAPLVLGILVVLIGFFSEKADQGAFWALLSGLFSGFIVFLVSTFLFKVISAFIPISYLTKAKTLTAKSEALAKKYNELVEKCGYNESKTQIAALNDKIKEDSDLKVKYEGYKATFKENIDMLK